MSFNLDATDIRTPRAAAAFLARLSGVMHDMGGEAELFRSNQHRDGVADRPLAFLSAIHDQLSGAGTSLGEASLTAARHANKIDDTIGASASLVGTQAGGGYSDPRAE